MNSFGMKRRPFKKLSCMPDNQTKLLETLLAGQIQTFTSTLASSYVEVDYVYENYQYKTCLEIACCKPKKLEFVNRLLDHKADVNRINGNHLRAPLHFAIQYKNFDVVERLIRHPNIDVNICVHGNTPLNFLVKEALDDDLLDTNIEDYIKCMKLLLAKQANPNIPNLRNFTPIYLCAKGKQSRLVSTILDHSKIGIDVDTHKDRSKKSARSYIEENNLYPNKLPEYTDIDTAVKNDLFVLLSQKDENKFLEKFNKCLESGSEVANWDNGLYTLLQLATDRELENVVKTLIECRADVNLATSSNAERPIKCACRRGNKNILKLFMDHDDIFIPDDVLHSVTKYVNECTDLGDINFRECVDLLLDDKRIDVNRQDDKGNTALHYAAREADDRCVMKLLDYGASVAIPNVFNVLPLADISPNVFKQFLDKCLDENAERCTDENYKIIFKYEFLAPSTNSKQCTDERCNDEQYNDDQCKVLMNNDMKDSHNNNDEEDIVMLSHEAHTLLYMSQNPELKHLLKHPVLTSFLYLKWNCIKHIFYINIVLYIAFCLLLVGYILYGYGPHPEENTTFKMMTLQGLLAITIALLGLREFVQLIVNPKKYFSNLENWLETALIVLSLIIVTHKPSELVRQELSSIAILLCACELILLAGHIPMLSTYIVMLRTVSWNFFKFILWYSILIIAFALSFYTLFRNNSERPDTPMNTTETIENGAKDDEEEDFFHNPGISLFKTIVMLTGEFDVSDIDFKQFPITSHVIFILFIFLIAIVLFNLLNGLAVSDTQTIKNNAELVGYILRIQLVSYMEHMFLGSMKRSKSSNRFMCCIQPVKKLSLCLRPFAKYICLFPKYLPENQIAVMPNCDREIVFKDIDKRNDTTTKTRWCSYPGYQMDYNVMKSAKHVLIEKNTIDPIEQFAQTISNYELELQKYEKRFNTLEQQITQIVKVLSEK